MVSVAAILIESDGQHMTSIVSDQDSDHIGPRVDQRVDLAREEVDLLSTQPARSWRYDKRNAEVVRFRTTRWRWPL